MAQLGEGLDVETTKDALAPVLGVGAEKLVGYVVVGIDADNPENVVLVTNGSVKTAMATMLTTLSRMLGNLPDDTTHLEPADE